MMKRTGWILGLMLWAVACLSQVSITDTIPPGVLVGGTHTFHATGGTPPYTWTATGPNCASSSCINSSTGVYTAPTNYPATAHDRGCQMLPSASIWTTPVDTLPASSYSDQWMSQIRASQAGGPAAWHGPTYMFSAILGGTNVVTSANPLQPIYNVYGPNANGVPEGSLFPTPVFPDVSRQDNGSWNLLNNYATDVAMISIAHDAIAPSNQPGLNALVPCQSTEIYTPAITFDAVVSVTNSVTTGAPTMILAHTPNVIAYENPIPTMKALVTDNALGSWYTTLGNSGSSRLWGWNDTGTAITGGMITYTAQPLSNCGSYTTGQCWLLSWPIDSSNTTTFPVITSGQLASFQLGFWTVPGVIPAHAITVGSSATTNPYTTISPGWLSAGGASLNGSSLHTQELFDAVQQGKNDLGHAFRTTVYNGFFQNATRGSYNNQGSTLALPYAGYIWPALNPNYNYNYAFITWTAGNPTTGKITSDNYNIAYGGSTAPKCTSATGGYNCACPDNTVTYGTSWKVSCQFQLVLQTLGAPTSGCWATGIMAHDSGSGVGIYTATVTVAASADYEFTLPYDTTGCTPPTANATSIALTAGVPMGTRLRLKPYNPSDSTWSGDSYVCTAADKAWNNGTAVGWMPSSPMCKYVLVLIHTLQKYGMVAIDGIGLSYQWSVLGWEGEFLTPDVYQALRVFDQLWSASNSHGRWGVNNSSTTPGQATCGVAGNQSCAFDGYIMEVVDESGQAPGVYGANCGANCTNFPTPSGSTHAVIDNAAANSRVTVTVTDSASNKASIDVLPTQTSVGVYPEKIVLAYGTTYQFHPWITGNVNTAVTYTVPSTIDGVGGNALPTGAILSSTGLLTAPSAATDETAQPSNIPAETVINIASTADPGAQEWVLVDFVPTSSDGAIRIMPGNPAGRYLDHTTNCTNGGVSGGCYWWGANSSFMQTNIGNMYNCASVWYAAYPNPFILNNPSTWCGGSWHNSAGWTGVTDYQINAYSMRQQQGGNGQFANDQHMKIVVPPGNHTVTMYGEDYPYNWSGTTPLFAVSKARFDFEVQGVTQLANQGLDPYVLAGGGQAKFTTASPSSNASAGVLDVAVRGREAWASGPGLTQSLAMFPSFLIGPATQIYFFPWTK